MIRLRVLIFLCMKKKSWTNISVQVRACAISLSGQKIESQPATIELLGEIFFSKALSLAHVCVYRLKVLDAFDFVRG